MHKGDIEKWKCIKGVKTEVRVFISQLSCLLTDMLTDLNTLQFHIYQGQGDFKTKTLGRAAPRGGKQGEVNRRGMPGARTTCFFLHDNHPQLTEKDDTWVRDTPPCTAMEGCSLFCGPFE